MDPLREKTSGEQTPLKDRLVVIVDDDASVRRSMRRLVSSLGFAAAAFGTAEELLAADVAGRSSCLILDVRMPGMDGLALQAHLLATGLRVPIVFVTALASEEEERRARSAGAIDMLRKPVGKDQLVDALRRALETPTEGTGGGHDG